MNNKNLWLWVAIGIIVIAAIVGWYYYYMPADGVTKEERELTELASELEGLNLDDLDSELEEISKELEGQN